MFYTFWLIQSLIYYIRTQINVSCMYKRNCFDWSDYFWDDDRRKSDGARPLGEIGTLDYGYRRNKFFFIDDAILWHKARLAQSVEHETLNLGVVGSSTTLGVLFLFPVQISITGTTIYFPFSKAKTNILSTLFAFLQILPLENCGKHRHSAGMACLTIT